MTEPDRPSWAGRLEGRAVVPWVLVVLTVAVHAGLAVHMRTPVIHADEYGYLMGAHYMARGGLATAKPFSPGYSVLIIPLWWVSDSAATVYRWTLEINALLAGLTTFLLFRLARRLLPGAGSMAWAGAAVVVSAYPALMLWSDLAVPENLLVPGFVLLCLLLLRAREHPTVLRWMLVGADTGLLSWVHERAVVLAVVGTVVALATLRPWRVHLDALTTYGSALALTLAGGVALSHYVTADTPGHQLADTGSSASGLIQRVTSGSGLAHMGGELAGQGLYLLIGTAGLFCLALAVLASRRRLGGWASPPPAPLPVFLLLVLGAEVVLAAVYLATGNRIDDVIYGRYVEAFIPPVLLVGALAGLRLARPADRWRGRGPLLIAAGGLAVTALGVTLEWGRTLTGTVVTSNIFALAHVVKTSPTSVSVTGLALLGLLLTAAVVAGFRLSPVGGAGIAVALMVPASAYGYSYLIGQSDGRLSERALPAAIVAIQQRLHVECVSWDAGNGDDWAFYNTRLFAPEMTFDVFTARTDKKLPCDSGLVVSDHSLNTVAGYSTAQLLLAGPSPASLWVMPGPLQKALGGHVP